MSPRRSPAPTPAVRRGCSRDLLDRPPGRRPAGRHGHSQRHAEFVFRRRPVPRSRGRHRACAPHGRGRRRHPRHRRRVDPTLWRALFRCRSRTNSRGSNRFCRRSSALGVPVSIDTMKAEGRRWALDAGATIVNDVWGLQRDPDMARVVAEHRRRRSSSCTTAMPPIRRSTSSRTSWRSSRARSRSPRGPALPREHIVLDPGIGFGKTPEQSITVIARLDAFKSLRPAAPGRRVAQTLHHSVMPIAARASGSAARSPPTLRPCATAPRSCASMTSPTPCRRCASPMSSRRHECNLA